MEYPAHRHREPETRLAGYLTEARERMTAAARQRPSTDPAELLLVGPDFEALRWFWLPGEIGRFVG
jgi:hypothetical protein